MSAEMTEKILVFMQFGVRSAGILGVIILGIFFFIVVRRSLGSLHSRGHISESVFVVSRNIIRWLAIILVVLFVLQQLGVKVSSIISTLLTIAAMIAVGFIAVWSVLSNFLCSILLIIFKPFRIGDDIEITEPVAKEGLPGQVHSFNVMYTTLRVEDAQGEVLIRVPNNIFFQKAIRGRAGSPSRSLEEHLLTGQPFISSDRNCDETET